MSLAQTLAVFEALDDASASGATVRSLFAELPGAAVEVRPVTSARGSTELVTVSIAGSAGRQAGGSAPTLGVIGRLGGIGARPSRIGLVSDADGAIAALAIALKLARMQARGDAVAGDVVAIAHVCPNAPIIPHHPVDHMDCPVDLPDLLRLEVTPEMDAVISIDSTKANDIINHKGIAISPTVKEGYLLPTPAPILRALERSTGRPAYVFPLTTQDITPYGNGVAHLNSILQPSINTEAPVIGLAICSAAMIPGSATGGSQELDIDLAVRCVVEVAKDFGAGRAPFFDADELARLVARYGSLRHLQR